MDASLIVADANKQRSTPGPRWNKELAAQAVSRATKDYLATLDNAAFGAASDVAPKFVSPSDPAAQWTGALRGPAFFAYADNYLVDVKSGIIMDVEASRAIHQAEVGAAKTMIERTEQREQTASQHVCDRGAIVRMLRSSPALGLRVPEGDVPLPRPRPVLKGDASRSLARHRRERSRETGMNAMFDLIRPLTRFVHQTCARQRLSLKQCNKRSGRGTNFRPLWCNR